MGKDRVKGSPALGGRPHSCGTRKDCIVGEAMGLAVRAEQVVSSADGGAWATEELNFKAVQGVRQEAFMRMIKSNVADIIIVQIVLEAQRYMVAYFLGASAKPKLDSDTCCHMRICDPTNQNHSPVRLMKQ